MWDMHKRITLNWYFLCQEDHYYYLLLHSASKSSQDTMQHQEKYTLQWNSYSDHLRKVLREMMTSSEFADVTLVTDDKQQIRAHRNILSACSPVFKSILQIDSKNANPVLYLRGIQYSEMESIMQFIYLGEARLYEERMSEFLTVSKNLAIKELSTGIAMNDQVESNGNNVADEYMDIAEAPPHTLHEEGVNVEPQAQTKPITPNNAANRILRRTEIVLGNVKFQCQDCEKTFSGRQGLWHHIKSKHEGVKYACNQCDYQATQQGHLTAHIESLHEGVKYACNQCDKQFTQQSHVTTHIQNIHECVKYSCNQCDYQATKQSNLTRHIQSKHKSVQYACN